MGYSSIEAQILAQSVLNLGEPSVLWSKLTVVPQSKQHTSGSVWLQWMLGVVFGLSGSWHLSCSTDQKGCGEGVDVTMIQAASCMNSRYWKTLLCRKWSGTRAAWSPACVSWSPGWSLLWYGELRGLSALVCCLLPHPTLMTLQWESGLIRHVNRPLWLAITFV